MFWDDTIALLVIFDLPLKFGSKRSTLNFWVFGPPGSVSALFTNWDWNYSRGQTKWNLTNWWVYLISTRRDEQKTRNRFEIGEFWFFSQNLSKLSFLQKSRWFSSETVEGGWDKLNKGYKNLEFFDETFNIPSPHESATLTNWRHRKPTPGAPGSHLPVKLVSLAHRLSSGGWKLEGGVLGYPSRLSLPL